MLKPDITHSIKLSPSPQKSLFTCLTNNQSDLRVKRIKYTEAFMKILLVTFSDNADHQDTLFGLYEQLAPNGNTYLLTTKEPKVPLHTSDHTWLVDCPKRPGIVLKTFDIFTLASIIRRIRKEKFDIVYFESLHVWNILIALALPRKTHTCQVIHEVIPHEGDKQVKGVDFMNKTICKTIDTIILRNRKYVTDMVHRYQISPDRVKYLELWRRYPDYTQPVHSGHVLFFGRINPYKGADNLLEIVNLCPDIHFDIIGRVDPQMEPIVKELEKKKNVHVQKGYVSDDAMKKAFINCDWAIVPYNSASQSGIIIDAYKFSRPVIAFNVGAIPEQIDDERSGYLIAEGDNRAFATKIKEAMALPRESYDAFCSYAYQYGRQKYSAVGAVDRFYQMINDRETK